MNKTQLRRHHLDLRAGQDVDSARLASFQLLDNLYQLPYWNQAMKVHIYLPIEAQREVNTWSLFATLIENGYAVFVPAINDDKLVSVYVNETEFDDIKDDARGIPTPPVPEHVYSESFDTIIIPCVAADLNRFRLGHGSGMYDRFLQSQPHATKIGLCFDMNIEEHIPHQKHDVKLTRVVTESRII